MNSGISIIICCYNSERRLPATLKAISEQVVSKGRFWEVIVVDNGCTDRTLNVGSECWQAYGSPAPIRFISEPAPGLSNARFAGIQACRASLAVFCDDDNWLSAGYLETAITVMESDSLIGACGGQGFPVFESNEPAWFNNYREAFATGPQSITSANDKQYSLYGAGLVVRVPLVKQIWLSEFNRQFEDRIGNQLSSSGDTELTNIICLLGYRNYYCPELQFRHYMPDNRMTTKYLKRLYIAFGSDGPIRNIYHSFLSDRILHLICLYWPTHVLLISARIVKYLILPPKKGGRSIYLAWGIAYLKSLLRLRKRHQSIVDNIRNIIDSDISVNRYTDSKLFGQKKSVPVSYE